MIVQSKPSHYLSNRQCVSRRLKSLKVSARTIVICSQLSGLCDRLTMSIVMTHDGPPNSLN